MKKIYLSKTIWVGTIEVVIGILTAIQADLVSGVTITIAGIIMIILRAVTKQGITL